MTDSARQKIEKAEKRKQKKGETTSSKKKRKGNAGEQLKTALVKDAVVRAGSKPIFVQPPNLSDGCYLKDYQLEGVRWLASLYENGVSGILADEVCIEYQQFWHCLFVSTHEFLDLRWLWLGFCRWDWGKRSKSLL